MHSSRSIIHPFLFSFKAFRSATLWTCVCFIIAVRLPTGEKWVTHHHTVTLKLPHKNFKVAETSAEKLFSGQTSHLRCEQNLQNEIYCANLRSPSLIYAAHIRRWCAFKIPHAQPDIAYNWIFNYIHTAHQATRINKLLHTIALFINYLFWLPFIECNSICSRTRSQWNWTPAWLVRALIYKVLS